MMLFIGSLHSEGLALVTAKSYLAAVRYVQISRGIGDPGFLQDAAVRVCHEGNEEKKLEAVRRRLPIKPEISLTQAPYYA